MSAAPSGSRALQALFWVGVCFSVLMLLVLGSLTGRNRAEYSTLGHAKSGDRPDYVETLLDNPEIKNSKTDQLRWFISRYGKPDHDDSTQYDHPRPPFVTRWLDYRREQIRVSFYPVDGGIDTNYRSLSPPYRGWRIIGFI